jgi:adenylate cyclase, class 2
MKEIEVKARIKNLDQLIKNLEGLGCKLSDYAIQEDKIFLDEDTPFEKIRRGTNVLRVRKQDNKNVFTLKKRLENELTCIEHETIIENIEELEKILGHLGYLKAVKVNKKRRKCSYNDYEICLDEVEELGNFIEVEKFSDEDSLKVQRELKDFLISLGIEEKDFVKQGYDTLIYQSTHE